MIDCKICKNSYDEKDFENCPYCGDNSDEGVEEAVVNVPVSNDSGPSTYVSGMGKKKAGSSLKYILIIMVILLAVAVVVYYLTLTDSSVIVVPDKYPSIQEAIDAAEDGEEIMVREGVYRENIDFRGKNIILRSENPEDPKVVERTIIDGGRGGTVVSFRSGETDEAILEGFSIIRGSGILVSGNSYPVIRNNIIEDNIAEFGGGIVIFDSAPTIIDNRIIGNSGFLGGGIFIEGSSPHIEGNLIQRNRAEMGSGVVIISNSSPTLINNQIVDNTAASLGGGIVIAAYSTPIIAGNVISGNLAERNGGGILIEESEPVIEKNTITNNSAANGGGIFIVNSLSNLLKITDNTINDNYAFLSGGGIYMEGSSPLVERNHFNLNVAERNGGAVILHNSNPRFILNVFEGNEAGEENGGGAVWVSADSLLELNSPDDNSYTNNKPDDIRYQ